MIALNADRFQLKLYLKNIFCELYSLPNFMNERLNIMLRLKGNCRDSACWYMISLWYRDVETVTVYTTVLTNTIEYT